MENNDPKRFEFSVRQTWNGSEVLRVRTFERFAINGEWMDADARHLPEFFRRVNLPKSN